MALAIDNNLHSVVSVPARDSLYPLNPTTGDNILTQPLRYYHYRFRLSPQMLFVPKQRWCRPRPGRLYHTTSARGTGRMLQFVTRFGLRQV